MKSDLSLNWLVALENQIFRCKMSLARHFDNALEEKILEIRKEMVKLLFICLENYLECIN